MFSIYIKFYDGHIIHHADVPTREEAEAIVNRAMEEDTDWPIPIEWDYIIINAKDLRG